MQPTSPPEEGSLLETVLVLLPYPEVILGKKYLGALLGRLLNSIKLYSFSNGISF